MSLRLPKSGYTLINVRLRRKGPFIMLQLKPDTADNPALKVVQPATNIPSPTPQETDPALIRQQMYARIAHGQAIEEAEQHARRKWSGQR